MEAAAVGGADAAKAADGRLPLEAARPTACEGGAAGQRQPAEGAAAPVEKGVGGRGWQAEVRGVCRPRAGAGALTRPPGGRWKRA